jgi:hypothetical protein
MSRATIASIFGFLTVASAYAGTVQIGGTNGLTSNYILQGAGATCAAGAGNCITGSTTGWAEKNYVNTLFQGVSNSGTTPASPVPFTGYAQTGGTPSGSTAADTAHNVTYAMVSDGAIGGNNSANGWESTATGGGTDSIVVPIGLYGVTDLWTMLDNQWGSIGGNDTSVSFTFGNASNATSGLTNITVALVDSNNTGNNAEMRAALSCATVTTATCSNSTNPHGALTEGNVINGVTVNTGVVYNSFVYDTTQAGGFYAGTQGRLKLDDQQFVFSPSLSNLWLVSMTITENIANTYTSSPTNPSETFVSAITVDTVPEPGTVLLFIAGLGGLGLARRKRN